MKNEKGRRVKLIEIKSDLANNIFIDNNGIQISNYFSKRMERKKAKITLKIFKEKMNVNFN